MAASLRLSRGFHRLALFLAAIPLLIGIAFLFIAILGASAGDVGKLAPRWALGSAITLAISLAVYGIVRAIGWVIGGFVS
jgi:hypothetical protein